MLVLVSICLTFDSRNIALIAYANLLFLRISSSSKFSSVNNRAGNIKAIHYILKVIDDK